MSKTIGFIGGGNMSSAIIGGMIDTGQTAGSIVVADPNSVGRNGLAARFSGIHVTDDNSLAAGQADILVLGVKPQVLREVCDEIHSVVRASRPLVISIAAGIQSETIDSWLGGGLAVVRVMPNQPALLGLGMSGLYANSQCSTEQTDAAVKLMTAVGKVVMLNRESDIDTVTAISGSGPAYFYLLAEILIEKALAEGLSPAVARELAVQTAVGSAAVMQNDETELAILIDRVRSPGGTTEAALNHLEQHAVHAIFAGALDAARDRATRLSTDAQSTPKKD